MLNCVRYNGVTEGVNECITKELGHCVRRKFQCQVERELLTGGGRVRWCACMAQTAKYFIVLGGIC
jgi:hypothetical protein